MTYGLYTVSEGKKLKLSSDSRALRRARGQDTQTLIIINKAIDGLYALPKQFIAQLLV